MRVSGLSTDTTPESRGPSIVKSAGTPGVGGHGPRGSVGIGEAKK